MRCISPSFLVVTVLMAIFPWVDVRCGQRGFTPFALSRSVVDQNAFQIAIGEVRYNKLLTAPGRNPEQLRALNEQMQAKSTETPAAPLIWMVLGCSLLGVIVGYAVPDRKPRLIVMVVAALGAGGAMLAQGLLGFPLLKQATPDKIRQFLAAHGINEIDPNFDYTAGFTFYFYLAVVGLAGGVIGVLVDFLNPPAPVRDQDREDDRSPRRSRRWRDEEDDRPPRREYDDEPGPPPRRRYDDDEPGPPPRRRRSEDEGNRPSRRPEDDRLRP